MNETAVPYAAITAEQRELLDQVMDKWSLHVLEVLCGRSRRFNELRRDLPGITQKSLTATLRRLERNGMVDRVVLGTRPLAVEYRISALGNTLQDLIDALYAWTSGHMAAVATARERFDAEES